MSNVDDWPPALVPYVELITDFTSKRMTASAFESQFLDLYKHDRTAWTTEAFDILDGLFGEVDDYTPYVELRDDGDATDDDFREQAVHRLEQLWRLGETVVRA